MIVLWQSSELYESAWGVLDQLLIAVLNCHFIDLIRKNKRTSDAQISVREQLITKEETGNRMTRTNQLLVDQTGIEVDDQVFWEEIKSLLSIRQWTWVYYY